WPARSRSSRCAASASTTISSTSMRAVPSRSTGRNAFSAPPAARASSRFRPPARSASSASGSRRSRRSIRYPMSNRFSLSCPRTLGRLKRNLHPTPIGLADVPGELRRKLVGESGRFLLQIQPKVDIWDRNGAERFIRELRTVDADVAGTPVITFEAIRYMERAYKEGTLYAFLLVGLLTAVIVRRTRESVLATISLVLGT